MRQRCLRELGGSYDFIFYGCGQRPVSAFSAGYASPVKGDGGLLISDNVLQDGDILESRYRVTRRTGTIHARMREYLYVLKHHPELITSVLPVGRRCGRQCKE